MKPNRLFLSIMQGPDSASAVPLLATSNQQLIQKFMRALSFEAVAGNLPVRPPQRLGAQRKQVVRAVRDAAMQIVQARGLPVTVSEYPAKLANFEGFKIGLMTAPDTGQTILDIWPEQGSKVFSLRLGADSAEDLVSFKNGPWVHRFLSLPPPCAALSLVQPPTRGTP